MSVRPRGDDVRAHGWRHVPPRWGRALRAALPVREARRPELRRRPRRDDGGRCERSSVRRVVAGAAQRAVGGRGAADRDGAEDGGGEPSGSSKRRRRGLEGGARGRGPAAGWRWPEAETVAVLHVGLRRLGREIGGGGFEVGLGMRGPRLGRSWEKRLGWTELAGAGGVLRRSGMRIREPGRGVRDRGGLWPSLGRRGGN